MQWRTPSTVDRVLSVVEWKFF